MRKFTASDRIFCYFDVETTGLDPRNHNIIEFALMIDSNQCTEIEHRCPEFKTVPHQFESLIHTTTVMSPRAKQKHQISTEMLHNKPTFASVFKQLTKYLKSIESITNQRVLLVAHFAEFDISFLEKECSSQADLASAFKQLHFSCSMNGVKNTYGRLYRLSLQALYNQYVRKYSMQNHRAMGDCEMLMQIVHHLPNNEEFYQTLVEDRFSP
jgi:DNA polymerase III epsilon subunit-like protein